jgi:hypothetical protein
VVLSRMAKVIAYLSVPLAPFALIYVELSEIECKSGRLGVLAHAILFASLHVPVKAVSALLRRAPEGSWLHKLISPLARALTEAIKR